jgi:outer membrane protein assembly factor BamB
MSFSPAIVLVLVLVAVSQEAVSADYWSRFRGPNGTGVATTTGIPTEFGPDKNVVWKTPLPSGLSSPVLSSDRIFLTAAEGNHLFTICVAQSDGKILWKREAVRERTDKLRKPNSPASPTPVTDGENVYVFFQDVGLLAYTKNGKERWRLPLGPFNVLFGFGASPILVDKNVILPVDQDTLSYLIAVDKDKGRVQWKIERPDVVSGYSTPLVYQPKRGPKQLLLAESFRLSSYSAKTGERLWFVPGLACEMKSVPSFSGDIIYINGWGFPENQPGQQIRLPGFEDTAATHDLDKDGKLSLAEMPHEKLKQAAYFNIFDTDGDGKLNQKEWELCRAMLSSENGLLAITVGGQGNMSQNVRWKYQRPVPQVPSTLLYQDVLFMVNDSGILISFDPVTGRVIKQGRLKGATDKYFSSPVGADGKVWLVSQDGTVSVVKAIGEWEVLAVNALGDECYATPAIANARLYVRTQGLLYCFGQSH